MKKHTHRSLQMVEIGSSALPDGLFTESLDHCGVWVQRMDLFGISVISDIKERKCCDIKVTQVTSAK